MEHFNFLSSLTLIYRNVCPIFYSTQYGLGARHKGRNRAPRLLRPALLGLWADQQEGKCSENYGKWGINQVRESNRN